MDLTQKPSTYEDTIHLLDALLTPEQKKRIFETDAEKWSPFSILIWGLGFATTGFMALILL